MPRPDPTLFWPLARTAHALDALLLRSKIAMPPGATFAEYIPEGRDLGWLKRLPQGLACEASLRVLPTSSLIDRVAVERGPCLICDQASDSTLAVVFDSASRARLVRPDGTDERVSRAHIMDLVLSTRSQSGLEALFEGLKGADAALRALSSNEFDTTRSTIVSFGPDAAHSFVQQLIYEGAFRSLAFHLFFVTLQGLISLIALWTLGSSIAEGHVNFGILAAWTAITLTGAPVQYMGSRALRSFSVALGARMKRRVLEGAFKIEESEIRRHGYGGLLARANETAIVERLDMINIFGAMNSVTQLVISGFLFERSNSFRPLVGAILIGVVVVGLLGYRIFQSFAETYRLRLRLTDDLVDKLLGHRTRGMQQPPPQYHVTEDANMAAYAKSAKESDNLRTISAALPRLWLIGAGSIVLGAFLVRDTPASLAWSAVGVVFASQAFGALAGWLMSVATWRTSFEGVRPLIVAGRNRDKVPRRADIEIGEKAVPVVLSATSLGFSYRAGGFPILNEATLRVHRGEKILVTGPSGGGKTTLFKLIGGELRPTGGVVLVGGADAHLVSDEEWRERVASAPQFHENYVFAQPLAFNLDPRGAFADASEEAKAICAELGLDKVIERMPQRYAQLLGETGWQLSHGERSRLFIARALLQGAEVFLFDESFGALDPNTQLLALECVRRRAKTLMVIAHA